MEDAEKTFQGGGGMCRMGEEVVNKERCVRDPDMGGSKYNLTIEEAKKKLKKMKTVDICGGSGAVHSPKKGFSLAYLNDVLEIQPTSFTVSCSDPKITIDPTFELLVLHYLRDARNNRLTSKWVSYRELPSGGFYYPVFRVRAEAPLAKRFGSHPDLFRKAAFTMGGEPIQYGDAACKILTFPRLPLVYILWAKTEEFPARASVLFDSSAENHLNIEDLAYLGQTVTRSLIESVRRMPQSK